MRGRGNWIYSLVMLGQNFRPWGELDWLLSRCEPLNWSVIGGVSFEERCASLLSRINSGIVSSRFYLNILPPESQISDSQNQKLLENISQLNLNGLLDHEVTEYSLKEKVSNFLQPIDDFLSRSNGNVILDISTLPKRFFFPIVKRLMKNESIENLLVTYTKPEKYSSGELSWDPSDWSHLPLFMADDFKEKPELAIISVGFVPLGIQKLLVGPFNEASVQLLFPHPPGAPNYQRNWEFVRRIAETYPKLSINEMQRVHALNLSDAFDKLCDLTDNGSNSAVLAPYGPKPVSLAMALYAVQQGVPVYYTQPNFYSADYSTGCKETYAYWIVNSGSNLYQVIPE